MGHAAQASWGWPWEAAKRLSGVEAPLTSESPGVIGVTRGHPGAELKSRHCVFKRTLVS